MRGEEGRGGEGRGGEERCNLSRPTAKDQFQNLMKLQPPIVSQ